MAALFGEQIFKGRFLKENFCILIQISLKCVFQDPSGNMSALV